MFDLFGGLAPDVAIDDLLVWYSALPAEEIWNLYMQDGHV